MNARKQASATLLLCRCLLLINVQNKIEMLVFLPLFMGLIIVTFIQTDATITQINPLELYLAKLWTFIIINGVENVECFASCNYHH